MALVKKSKILSRTMKFNIALKHILKTFHSHLV